MSSWVIFRAGFNREPEDNQHQREHARNFDRKRV